MKNEVIYFAICPCCSLRVYACSGLSMSATKEATGEWAAKGYGVESILIKDDAAWHTVGHNRTCSFVERLATDEKTK